MTRSHQVEKPALATDTRLVTEPNNHKVSHHIVKSGETLYSISWKYNLDYRDIARWNNIGNSYVIHPYQSIRLNMPFEQQTVPKQTTKKKPQTPKKIELEKYVGKVNWRWPTAGRLIRSNLPISRKGLNISGKLGQAINTAAPGVVVYSGDALLGYGNLVIIKHNASYLSAYAHNSSTMVQTGENVSSGQQIAKMGQDSSGKVLLHFEIRKDGRSVNPINYLPKKEAI